MEAYTSCEEYGHNYDDTEDGLRRCCGDCGDSYDLNLEDGSELLLEVACIRCNVVLPSAEMYDCLDGPTCHRCYEREDA